MGMSSVSGSEGPRFKLEISQIRNDALALRLKVYLIFTLC